MRVDGNAGATLAYVPNSANEWADRPDFSEPPLAIRGDADHWDHRLDEDHYSQPGNLFRLMTPAQRQVLFENTARAMGDVPLHNKQRHFAHCVTAYRKSDVEGQNGSR